MDKYILTPAEKFERALNAQDKEIARLREEIADLRGQISALSMFSPGLHRCKSCKGYYPSGYVCGCGRDNSYSDTEWAEVESARKEKP
jgi:hypothetical protein